MLASAPNINWDGRLIHIDGRIARVVDVDTANSTITIYPAIRPETLPTTLDRRGWFLCRVVRMDGGERVDTGMRPVTLEVVEAVGAVAPETPGTTALPENVVYWRGRPVYWRGKPVVWISRARTLTWRGRDVALTGSGFEKVLTWR